MTFFSICRLITITVFFTAAPAFSQIFQIKHSQISAEEARFDIIYTGPSAEITLPKRSRVIEFSNQNNISLGNNNIIIKGNISENSNGVSNTTDTSTQNSEFSFNFSYTLLLNNQGGGGKTAENWYPAINNSKTTYYLTAQRNISSEDSLVFAYPYTCLSNNTFIFSGDLNPKLVIAQHSVEKIPSENSNIPVTLFKSHGFNTPLSNVKQIYDHFSGIFGSLDIKEIIIINNALIREQSVVQNSQLYLMLPGNTDVNQLTHYIANAWNSQRKNFSLRLFAMIKDSVIRLNKINFDSTNTQTLTTVIETNDAFIVPVGSKDHYKNLMVEGFSNNQVINANITGMMKNYALLHMARFNIGTDTLLAGIKAYFADNNSTTSTNTNNTNDIVSNTNDLELIDWKVITQNKLQEPLYSLYLKEVLRQNHPITPHIKANGHQIERNSLYIPDFTIIDNNGSTLEITWKEKKVTEIMLSNGSYTLDAELQVPQKIFTDSYFTFDSNERQERRAIIFAAEKHKVPGEQSLRNHLQVLKLYAPADNKFNINEGTTVYFVISHILSNLKGTLQDSIKESLFVIDEYNKPKHIATRIRI
ncbi:MAG: hypothetical protein ACRCTQ_06840 [Brevinemataceae bacterium]